MNFTILVDYYEAQTIGYIIGFAIVIIGLIVFCLYKAGSNASIEQLWRDRVQKVDSSKNNFYNQLRTKNFKIDYKVTTNAYYHTPTRIEIFSMCFDYDNKKIAFCSFEEENSKVYIYNFADIKNFEILNGISNTTMQSFGTGASVGSYGLRTGIVSSNSYQETTMEKVKLKIETNSPYAPAIIVMMFNFQVNTGDETYQLLLNSCEQIKTSLSKIIENNKKQD